MMFAGTGLSGVAVVVRNDSAQTLFPFNIALGRRSEIRPKNLVPDVRSLVRSLLMVVRQPLPVDVVKLVKAHAKEMVQTLAFNLSDVIF
jgi:hypothetical protein